ncbi:amidohydrolase family protein [Desulfovibrio aerotolerans]|uniref:Amidohydrolase family protein n=1 Tax=Solidesulfovibrio aerotolerans TaxID=295255 RepID=A0A7C9IYE7_9BACT|nr:amidohydrolase family protein [Solidesulfovibrio aerotolerans]MYL84962.1 amidohydrolase family protein [Solidesulfovibrio aerotolerans]
MRNVVFLLAVLLFPLPQAALAATPPETIYCNARIVTLDAAGTVAQAVAVAEGKFLAVGDNETIKALAGPATKIIDLGGRLATPGLIDAHSHPMETIYLKDAWVDCRYPGTPSIAKALANIAAWAAKTPKGQWIYVACVSASENKFAEKRLPTKTELDAAAPDNPLVLANGAHQVVINSAAIKVLGLVKGMARMAHGATVVLGPDKEPTGVVLDSQSDIPTNPTLANLTDAYTSGIQDLWNRNGFTSVLAITPAAALPVLQQIAATGAKPHLRYTVSVWTASNAQNMPEDLRPFAMPEGADPAWYRFAAIKDWVDGENDARSGYMCEHYLGHDPTDPPGGHGTLVTDQAGLDRFAAIAARNGVIPMMHCSGDEAMTMGLDASEKLLKSGQPAPLMRLEHFGMFQLKDGQLARAKALHARGLRISVQPIWLTELVKADFENMPAKLAASGFQFRSMVEAGLEPAASTDMTGIYLGNITPLKAMAACVTRESDAGVFEPEQALTVEQALRMWTTWAAASMGEAEVKGSIAPGKYADMTVFTDDLFAIPKERIKDAGIAMTIVGGDVVYTNN